MRNDDSIEKSERYSHQLNCTTKQVNTFPWWLNVRSLSRLKANRRRVNNFDLVGLWIQYVSLHLGVTKFNIIFLSIKYDSDDFVILSKLFHSFTAYGKIEFLKSSVLTLRFGRGEKCVV